MQCSDKFDPLCREINQLEENLTAYINNQQYGNFRRIGSMAVQRLSSTDSRKTEQSYYVAI